METFGKYELLRKLATGGMAEVYLAREQGEPSGQPVVLKRLLSHLAQDQKFVAMFLAEAKFAALLEHPNVVRVLDFGQHEGEYYLAMEYIDGPSLRAVLRRAADSSVSLPLTFCCKVISLAAEGLAYAHDFCDPRSGQWLGLIHRDVTPENILVSKDGEVKLVDFGIAKAAAISQTKSHSLRGKYNYMAPEQLRRKTPLDRRVDIYALGVVLYELVTGKRPYEARGELALMRSILTQRTVPASRHRPEVPPQLEDILRRALARREDRYQACPALREDLEAFLKDQRETTSPRELSNLIVQLGVLPKRISRPETPAADAEAEETGPRRETAPPISSHRDASVQQTEPVTQSQWRHKWRSLAAAIAALLALAGLAYAVAHAL